MMSVSRFIPDAAYALRAADADAITATASLFAGELLTPLDAVWNAEVRDGKFVVFAKATEVKTSEGDETYVVEVITSETADLAAPTVHASKAVTAAGWLEMLVDQHSLRRAAPASKYFGVRVSLGGTAPTVKFEAYVLPPVGQ